MVRGVPVPGVLAGGEVLAEDGLVRPINPTVSTSG
jgi:hypothetical protein